MMERMKMWSGMHTQYVWLVDPTFTSKAYKNCAFCQHPAWSFCSECCKNSPFPQMHLLVIHCGGHSVPSTNERSGLSRELWRGLGRHPATELDEGTAQLLLPHHSGSSIHSWHMPSQRNNDRWLCIVADSLAPGPAPPLAQTFSCTQEVPMQHKGRRHLSGLPESEPAPTSFCHWTMLDLLCPGLCVVKEEQAEISFPDTTILAKKM